MHDKESKIIDLLIKHELKLSELYRNFASKISSDEEFWQSIAIEEIGHSNWIKDLSDGVVKGELNLSNEHLFDNYLIQASIDKLNGYIVANSEIPFSRLRCLELAYKYEKSLMEAKFFQVLKDDSNEIAEVFERLRSSTERHAQKIKSYLAER